MALSVRDAVAPPRLPAPALRLVDALGQLRRSTLLLTASAGLLAAALLDVVAGEIALSILYLIPVSIAAWYVHWRAAWTFALLAGVAWLIADLGQPFAHPLIPAWNALVRTGFFLSVGYALSALRYSLEHERSLARTDVLTGAANARFFREILLHAVRRARRRYEPLSLVFLDLDDFKEVNDRFGHGRGDELLREVADTIAGSLRVSDTLARLGGDEFAVLMPATDSAGAGVGARHLLAALHDRALGETLGVGFSAGVVTYALPPLDIDAIIGEADRLMYEAKLNGKGQARFLTIA